jgi:hypothetical protein
MACGTGLRAAEPAPRAEDTLMKAKLGKEIVVRTPNQVGVLAQLTKVVADKGINILAASVWVEGSEAVIRLVTDQPANALEALRANYLSLRENEVILADLAHQPGQLRQLCERLAGQGLDLRYLYATTTASQQQSLVVLACSDNGQAAGLLNG